MTTEACFADAFNMLCGDKLGSGIHRDVFECKIRPDLVAKVEHTDFRYFANVHEHKFWSDYRDYKPVAQWLAPCEYLSPDGRISLQRRVDPVRTVELPTQLPAFLTDIKPANFGWLDGRIVCVDYAFCLGTPSIRLRKVEWHT